MRTLFRPNSDRFTFAIAATLVVIACVVFGRLLLAEFVRWDDFDMIVGNALLRPVQWRLFWTHATFGLYTPLSYSLLALIATTSWTFAKELQPIWFHAASLSLHVVTTFAVWRLLTSFTRDRFASACGAALFLVHPLAVEPVAWSASLNTLLATALAIIALNLACHSNRAKTQKTQRLWFASGTLVFGLGLLAKPTICAIPLALLAIDRLMTRLPKRIAILRFATWMVVSIPFVLVGRWAQPASTIAAPSLLVRLDVAFDSFGFYLAEWIAPWRLCIDYGRTPDQIGANAATFLHFGLAFAVLFLAIHQRRKRPFILAAVLIAIAGVLPVLGLVPFDFQYYSSVADRYAYFATLGPAIVATCLLSHRGSWTPGRWMAATAIALLACLSWTQAGTWHDTYSLMRQALSVNPNSVAAYETLGYMHAQSASDSGNSSEKRSLEAQQAMVLYGRALQLRPTSARTHFNFANLLFKIGRSGDAIEHYSAAAATLGDDIRLQNNWGIACWQVHDVDGAIAHFDRAIQIDPSVAESFANKAIVLLRTGQPDGARSLCEQALQRDPQQPQALHCLAELNAAKR